MNSIIMQLHKVGNVTGTTKHNCYRWYVFICARQWKSQTREKNWCKINQCRTSKRLLFCVSLDSGERMRKEWLQHFFNSITMLTKLEMDDFEPFVNSL